MVVLYYLVVVSVLMFCLFNSGVVLSVVGIIKHRKSKNLEYKHCLATSVSISTVALVIFIVCIAVLKNM